MVRVRVLRVVAVVGVLGVAGLTSFPVSATPLPGGSTWTANAETYALSVGKQYTYTCPPGGTLGSVYGTNVYTDDSSVCTAAVNSGLITVATGGKVTIQIAKGRSSYSGSTRHGVSSNSYGSWPASYVFVKSAAPTTTTSKTAAAGGTGWKATAVAWRGKNGQLEGYVCPAHGSSAPIWGTTLYSDDSSVCAAAVHTGLISFATGRTVTIKIEPGKAAYAGSSSHGVVSQSVGKPGSFQFVK
jgi:LCCL domain